MALPQWKEDERAFSFLKINERPGKPRGRGVTEIRGPYYTPMGRRYLEDIFETMAPYVDALRFAGGSFILMPRRAVKDILELCHLHNVAVSTGGFIEYALVQGPAAVDRYIEECKGLGFDIIEISGRSIAVPMDDLLRLVGKVRKARLKAKGAVGIQTVGASGPAAPQGKAACDPAWAIEQAKRFIDAGAEQVMIESGIDGDIPVRRPEVVAGIVLALGLEKPVFEAADPERFAWYIENVGPEVNLFVDHSQIIQVESLRSGIGGTRRFGSGAVTDKAA
jgi:phosphosulfolactate synthase (CoM biosynthesis protein A)